MINIDKILNVCYIALSIFLISYVIWFAIYAFKQIRAIYVEMKRNKEPINTNVNITTYSDNSFEDRLSIAKRELERVNYATTIEELEVSE